MHLENSLQKVTFKKASKLEQKTALIFQLETAWSMIISIFETSSPAAPCCQLQFDRIHFCNWLWLKTVIAVRDARFAMGGKKCTLIDWKGQFENVDSRQESV